MCINFCLIFTLFKLHIQCFLDHMNLKIGSSNEEVDRTSNSSWSVCSNSANGAIGSISSSTSNNIDISNIANSPHYQGKCMI